MRKYQALWNQLKTDTRIVLVAPRSKHRQLLQGLRIESLKDTLYRFKCIDEKNQSFIIANNSVDDTLYIRLEFSYTIPKNFVNHRVY